MNNKGF